MLQDALLTRGFKLQALVTANVAEINRHDMLEAEPFSFTGHFPPNLLKWISTSLKFLSSMILKEPNLTMKNA